jgi:hypothetical protein
MKQTMVRYTVKPDRAEDNEALVREVYAELREKAPEGLQYATFVLGDGVSFVHVARYDENSDGNLVLTEMAAFKMFQSGLGERTDVAPAATPLREVGSYRFWGE